MSAPHTIIGVVPLPTLPDKWLVSFSCNIKGVVELTGADAGKTLTPGTIGDYPSGRWMLQDVNKMCGCSHGVATS